VGLPYSGDMGCLDAEVTELGQNGPPAPRASGGLSQSCLLQNWSKAGQPACPILCKYNKDTPDDRDRSYTDDGSGTRVRTPAGEDASWMGGAANLSAVRGGGGGRAVPPRRPGFVPG
jgi:hypothetical protein